MQLTHPEVLRRAAVLAGLLTAIWLFLWPAEFVYRVSLVDFAADQQKARWKTDRQMPLDQFIARRTKDRLVEVKGPGWERFFRMLINAKQGNEAPVLQGRKYQISPKYTAYYYFEADEEPMASLAHRAGPYTYLTMTMGGQRYYLGLNCQQFRWADDAPSYMLYPTRAWSWIPLVLGLLAYLFIPRAKRPEGAIGYSRFSAQVMPDILGLLLTGAFFALPLLVVPGNAGIWETFDFFGGWGIFTLICWVLLAGWGVVILGIAAWYGSAWLELEPDGFTRSSLRGVDRISYTDIESVRPYARRPPRWLVWGLLIFGRGHPGAVGQALIIDSRDSHGIEFCLKDGRSIKMGTDGMPGLDRLAKALRKAGVNIEDDSETDQS